MIEHPEWKKLDHKVTEIAKKLEEARAERTNWENDYVVRACYPSSAD